MQGVSVQVARNVGCRESTWWESVELERSECPEVTIEQRGGIIELTFHAVQNTNDLVIKRLMAHAFEVWVDEDIASEQLKDLRHVDLVERSRLISEDAKRNPGSMLSEQRGEGSSVRGQPVPAVEHDHHFSTRDVQRGSTAGEEANGWTGRG